MNNGLSVSEVVTGIREWRNDNPVNDFNIKVKAKVNNQQVTRREVEHRKDL